MSTNKYKLTSKFEQAVVRSLLFVPEFWERIGKEVEPDALDDQTLVLITKAIRSIAADNGRPAKNTIIVMQRIARWYSEGKITKDAMEAVGDRIDYLEDLDCGDVDEIVDELVPIIQRRANTTALRDGAKLIANNQAITPIINRLKQIDSIGQVVHSTEVMLEDIPELITESSDSANLKTLIREFDGQLGGGISKQTLNFLLCGTGGGKSMMLAHLTGSALLQGVNVLVATLELSKKAWGARVLANLTGETISDILQKYSLPQCISKLNTLVLGKCAINSFTQYVATVDDIINWADDIERRRNITFDALIVDYADLLAHSKKTKYDGMEEVYGKLRSEWAVKRNAWLWTASQSRRASSSSSNGKKKPVGIDDAADSQNKARLGDVVITMQLDPESDECEYFFAKNREAKHGYSVKLQVQVDIAQMAPIPGNNDPVLF